ncbi:MAG: beta-ketoacyl-[acyl-carrier-protein] synthase family protein [Bacteroidota bacterium]
MSNRVVVTGMGVICSIGNNVEEFEVSLREGRSGLKPIEAGRFDASDAYFRIQQGCTVSPELYAEVNASDVSILTEFSVRAIEEAIEKSGLDLASVDPRRVALCVGTSVGGSYPFMRWVQDDLAGKERDYELLRYSTPNITGDIARRLGIQGPLSTISTACASGTNSVGRGFDLIRSGRADYVIAGGVDIFTYLTFSGFNSLFALSKGNCKPFDKKRDGLNLGDAAAYVILESEACARARSAKVIAEVSGYAIVNEAYHATAPHPEGIYARQAMENALRMSGETPAGVDYINTHGTATKANDKMEIKAIESLIGEEESVHICSTKSLTGHSLGAAGSVEFVATALSVAKDFIPASTGVAESIVEHDRLHLSGTQAEERKVRLALSNSFGFSGNMASIAVRKYVTDRAA